MKNKTINSLSIIATAIALVAVPFAASAATVSRNLAVGMSGADVSSLQTFLSHDDLYYPDGVVTGYFGPLTKAAVVNFQTYNNLPKTGQIDAATLPVLDAKMALDGNGGPKAIISGVGVVAIPNSALIKFDTNEPAQGLVYFSTKPLAITEHWNSVDVVANMVATDKDFHTSQGIVIKNLQPKTTYYYMVSATDKYNNVSVSMPGVFVTPNATN